MWFKIAIASVLAVVLASCGGTTPNTAKKKEGAAATGRVFKSLSGLLLGSANANLRPQAGESLTVNCDTGTITYTLTETNNNFTFGLQTSAGGCREGTTTITTTGVGGFTFGYSFTSTANGGSFSITYNGGITVTDGGETDSMSFNNFSFTISYTGSTYTISLNGSATIDGETVTYNNETYSYSELGL
jgi:hypothetical protein